MLLLLLLLLFLLLLLGRKRTLLQIFSGLGRRRTKERERERERERKTIQLGMQERNFFMQSDKRSFNNFFPIDTSSSPCLRSAILPFFSLLLVSTVSLFVPYLFSILVLSIPSLCLIFFYFWFYHLPLSAPSPFFSIFGFYHVPLCAI